MSIKLGHSDLAKYPFLEEASVYIRETKFTIDELDRPEMDHIVSRAVNILEAEVNFGKVYSGLERYEIEILRFLVSLLIVKSLDLEPITRKHSLFEAIRAEKFLTDDLVREKSIQKKKLLLHKIFRDLFKIEIDMSSGSNLLRLSISDYLIRATKMNEQEWKLVNRSVNSGHVYLDPDEAVRLIRSELSNMIYQRIKNMKIKVMPSKIKICTMDLRRKFSSYIDYRYQKPVNEYPPCIKHAILLMSKGENLPHSARLMLATYMLALGKKIDEIIYMYKNAPDYNEKITRYQVEHLAGKKGSRTIYSVPSCAKLLSENLCFATADCNNIVNPLQFGRNSKIKL